MIHKYKAAQYTAKCFGCLISVNFNYLNISIEIFLLYEGDLPQLSLNWAHIQRWRITQVSRCFDPPEVSPVFFFRRVNLLLSITRGFAAWRFRVKLNGGFAVNYYHFFEVKSGTKSNGRILIIEVPLFSDFNCGSNGM